jgi:hypothetical protein
LFLHNLDLSFVDYDKFNQYEAQIDKMLNRLQNASVHDEKTCNNGRNKIISSEHKNVSTINDVVVRRRPKNILGTDVNRNLDREKNLYRQSIDSRKLKLLSSITDSHRWSQVVLSNDPMEWLSLENNATSSAQTAVLMLMTTNETML